jgi:hypothetical protein
MHQDSDVPPFTPEQTAKLRGVVFGMMAEYWAEDRLKNTIRERADERINQMFEHSVKAQVLSVMQSGEGPKVIENLFRQSGYVVRTEASQFVDGIVGALLTDPTTGMPEQIRSFVRANLQQLVLQAVTAIVTQMVVDYIKGNADALANGSRGLIETAFLNARMTVR